MSEYFLPPELWLLVISYMSGRDAKRFRLVNRQFCSMATAHVFQKVNLSHSEKHSLFICDLVEVLPRLTNVAHAIKTLTLAPFNQKEFFWTSVEKDIHMAIDEVHEQWISGDKQELQDLFEDNDIYKEDDEDEDCEFSIQRRVSRLKETYSRQSGPWGRAEEMWEVQFDKQDQLLFNGKCIDSFVAFFEAAVSLEELKFRHWSHIGTVCGLDLSFWSDNIDDCPLASTDEIYGLVAGSLDTVGRSIQHLDLDASHVNDDWQHLTCPDMFQLFVNISKLTLAVHRDAGHAFGECIHSAAPTLLELILSPAIAPDGEQEVEMYSISLLDLLSIDWLGNGQSLDFPQLRYLSLSRMIIEGREFTWIIKRLESLEELRLFSCIVFSVETALLEPYTWHTFGLDLPSRITRWKVYKLMKAWSSGPESYFREIPDSWTVQEIELIDTPYDGQVRAMVLTRIA